MRSRRCVRTACSGLSLSPAGKAGDFRVHGSEALGGPIVVGVPSRSLVALGAKGFELVTPMCDLGLGTPDVPGEAFDGRGSRTSLHGRDAGAATASRIPPGVLRRVGGGSGPSADLTARTHGCTTRSRSASTGVRKEPPERCGADRLSSGTNLFPTSSSSSAWARRRSPTSISGEAASTTAVAGASGASPSLTCRRLS